MGKTTPGRPSGWHPAGRKSSSPRKPSLTGIMKENLSRANPPWIWIVMAGYLLCICFTHTLLVSIMAAVCPAVEILIAPGFIEYQIEICYCISHLLHNMCTSWNISHTHTHTHTYTHTHTHSATFSHSYAGEMLQGLWNIRWSFAIALVIKCVKYPIWWTCYLTNLTNFVK